MEDGSRDRPNFSRRLFWEYRYDQIDWRLEYSMIIDRVIERGTHEEWEELVRFYGKELVIKTLKDETSYLPDEIIADVCGHFNLKPTELKCYTKKQSTPRHWI